MGARMGATRFRDLRGRFPHAEVPSVWNCVCDHTSLRWGGQKPRTDFGTQGLASCGGRNDVVESYRGNECRSGGCTILGEGDNNGNRSCPSPSNEQEISPREDTNRSHTLNRSGIGRPRNTPFSRGECVRASSLAPPPGKSSVDREVYEVWSVGVGALEKLEASDVSAVVGLRRGGAFHGPTPRFLGAEGVGERGRITTDFGAPAGPAELHVVGARWEAARKRRCVELVDGN